jgi:hypothetical protein
MIFQINRPNIQFIQTVLFGEYFPEEKSLATGQLR